MSNLVFREEKILRRTDRLPREGPDVQSGTVLKTIQ